MFTPYHIWLDIGFWSSARFWYCSSYFLHFLQAYVNIGSIALLVARFRSNTPWCHHAIREYEVKEVILVPKRGKKVTCNYTSFQLHTCYVISNFSFVFICIPETWRYHMSYQRKHVSHNGPHKVCKGIYYITECFFHLNYLTKVI